MTTLAQYERARAASPWQNGAVPFVSSSVMELRMSEKDELFGKFKRVTDVLNESMLVQTILRYARTGHASEVMVEQAILLVDKHIAWAIEDGSESGLRAARELKAGLEQALIDGIETLRGVRPPGPEVTEVEAPLANQRIMQRHQVRRQFSCAGGRIDIYDLTADEIIECKHIGTSAALGEAAGQLRRYCRTFPGSSLTIAVSRIEPEAYWLADVLRREGISIIEVAPE